jgi:SHS family lactate transporter-like MFS transporter
VPVLAWRREVTRAQWRAFFAAYLGWMLDGFDFTILTFVLVDITRSFTVNSALAGALGTVTLLFRLLGGIGAGTAADRWGRKLPLLLSIVWYSAFAGLSGFSTSYGMLFALRALFGIGMGGVWAAGMPLAIEHWPAHLRGRVSGMLQSGYSTGYILSAVVYQIVYPMVEGRLEGWRVMLWLGILPALLAVWILVRVEESPVWLARRAQLAATDAQDPVALPRLFRRDLIGTTIHASLVMGAFLCFYQSITFWYPTYVDRTLGRSTLPYLVALNVGAVAGNVTWGLVSETRLGRRGAATISTLGGVSMIPLYLFSDTTTTLLAGALLIGTFGAGNFGMVPSYLNERFPTAVRAAGAGVAYHVGAGLSSVMPLLVGALQDRGFALSRAMSTCIAITGVLLVVLMWLGPETRGRTLDS